MTSRAAKWGRERLRDALSMKTRRRIAWSRVAIRAYTGRYRVLPNLLVIGAQRCGTSSLYKYLGSHPEVAASLRKETRYFTLYFDKGEEWYRAHFPLRSLAGSSARVVFEATPDYMLDPRCAERVIRSAVRCKIVVILRDPVERAFSHYLHHRRLGQEPLSFEEALEQEESRLAPYRVVLEEDWDAPLPKEWQRYSYVTRGLYAEQLEPWYARFGADSILVLHSEDLFRKPAEVFDGLCAFLGISPWVPTDRRNHSYIGTPGRSRSTVEMPAPERAWLEKRFREPNRRLFELLGRSYDWS